MNPLIAFKLQLPHTINMSPQQYSKVAISLYLLMNASIQVNLISNGTNEQNQIN